MGTRWNASSLIPDCPANLVKLMSWKPEYAAIFLTGISALWLDKKAVLLTNFSFYFYFYEFNVNGKLNISYLTRFWVCILYFLLKESIYLCKNKTKPNKNKQKEPKCHLMSSFNSQFRNPTQLLDCQHPFSWPFNPEPSSLCLALEVFMLGRELLSSNVKYHSLALGLNWKSTCLI